MDNLKVNEIFKMQAYPCTKFLIVMKSMRLKQLNAILYKTNAFHTLFRAFQVYTSWNIIISMHDDIDFKNLNINEGKSTGR